MPRTHNTASKFIEKYGQLLSIEKENEKIYFRDEPLYYWAIVHQNKGEII